MQALPPNGTMAAVFADEELVTDAIKPGVVSMPHGWGHGQPGTRLGVANSAPGVNTNILSLPDFLDEPSGNGALNGIPVTVSAAGS